MEGFSLRFDFHFAPVCYASSHLGHKRWKFVYIFKMKTWALFEKRKDGMN